MATTLSQPIHRACILLFAFDHDELKSSIRILLNLRENIFIMFEAQIVPLILRGRQINRLDIDIQPSNIDMDLSPFHAIYAVPYVGLAIVVTACEYAIVPFHLDVDSAAFA